MRRKLPQGFSRRGSSNPLSMGAFSRRKDADPYAPIRDGAKQEVQGRANKPTERQKDLASYVLPHQDSITAIREGRAGVMDVADAALTLPGLALVKPFVRGGKQVVNTIQNIGDTDMGVAKKAIEFLGESASKLKDKVTGTGTVRGANNAATSAKPPKKAVTPKRNAPPKPKDPPKTQTRKRPANPSKTQTPKSPKTPKRVDETVQTNTNTGRAPYGGRGGATTPTPKSPANPSRLQRAVTAVKNNPGKTAAAVGGTAAATAAALAAKNKGDKQTPAKKKKATGSGQNPRKGYRQSPSKSANEELGISPGGKKQPKASKKPSKQPDDGYKFYGKKGTGLGDFSRKHGMQYATQKQFEKDFNMDDGEKAGGRPGRGKLKTQGMNKAGKRKAGFSGKGAGAALRGF